MLHSLVTGNKRHFASPVRFRVKGESSVCGNSKKICVKVFQGKSLSLDFAMVMQVGKLGDDNLNKAIADGLHDTKAPFDIHAFFKKACDVQLLLLNLPWGSYSKVKPRVKKST